MGKEYSLEQGAARQEMLRVIRTWQDNGKSDDFIRHAWADAWHSIYFGEQSEALRNSDSYEDFVERVTAAA